MPFGFGADGWGEEPWGGAVGASLQLLRAQAVAENAVQLAFSQPVYYSELLDPSDASQPSLFTVTPVPGSVGQDGTLARAVGVATVTRNDVAGALSGSVLVVTLDRPMTPQPALYVVSCSPRIQNADQTQSLNTSTSTVQFTAVFKKLVVPSLDVPTGVAGRDLAAPDDLPAAVASKVPLPQNLLLLGVPVVDDTGDYATDAGLVGLKKRVLRRIFFVPGATLHLTRYGAGATSYGKRLATSSTRSQLARACESQIAQEPDVAKVSVQTQPSTQFPGLFYLVVLVRSRSTGQGFKLLVPVQSTAQSTATQQGY